MKLYPSTILCFCCHYFLLLFVVFLNVSEYVPVMINNSTIYQNNQLLISNNITQKWPRHRVANAASGLRQAQNEAGLNRLMESMCIFKNAE
jgi:hypothetical protein